MLPMRSAFARECAADSAGPDLMRPQAEQKSCNGARLGGLRPLVGGAVGVQHVQREVDEEEAPVGRLAHDGDVVAVERAAAGARGAREGNMSRKAAVVVRRRDTREAERNSSVPSMPRTNGRIVTRTFSVALF
jgi:hypothetical protein